jgi:hypothetical protein
MKLMPHGDYYIWYCDWCDSRNLTLWTRVDKGEVTCGACHIPFAFAPVALEERRAGLV